MTDAQNPKPEAEPAVPAETAPDEPTLAETQELAPEDRPEVEAEAAAATEAAAARQVVYVHAPTPPKVRSNRSFGALLALVGGAAFALIYLGVVALYVLVTPSGTDFDGRIGAFLNSASFWVPILYFTLLFVGLALILNRAGWAAFVVGSLVVALLVYLLTIGTLLLTQNVVTMTPSEANAILLQLAGSAGVIIAALVAREVALWFGLAISTRGRKLAVRNAEARAAYDSEQAEKRAEYERAGATV